MNNLAEVYAQNIQLGQFYEILKFDQRSKEDLEYERFKFQNWLENKLDLGFKFDNQIDAWNRYTVNFEGYELGEDSIEYSWGSGLEEILLQQAEQIGSNDVDVNNIYYTELFDKVND